MNAPPLEATEIVQTRISVSDHEYICRAAERDGLSLSAYVRRLVRHHVSNPGQIG